MYPRINQRQMKRLLKKMNVEQLENVKEVIIKLEDKEIIIENPQVSKVNIMGQQAYQIIG